MLEPPPAVVMVSPDMPAKFSIEDIRDVEKDRSFRILPARADCRPSSPDEIVVCAHGNSRYRFGTPLADPDILMVRLGEKLHFHLGPIELGSFKAGDGRQLGIRIRF